MKDPHPREAQRDARVGDEQGTYHRSGARFAIAVRTSPHDTALVPVLPDNRFRHGVALGLRSFRGIDAVGAGTSGVVGREIAVRQKMVASGTGNSLVSRRNGCFEYDYSDESVNRNRILRGNNPCRTVQSDTHEPIVSIKGRCGRYPDTGIGFAGFS